MADSPIEVRMPLFDRLVDRNPEGVELVPMRTLDRRELRTSVRRELELLFSTRSSLPTHHVPLRDRSVLDYGIPDFSTFFARSFDDRARLAGALLRAIVAYEPRLADVRVRVEADAEHEERAVCRIEANLVVGAVREPVAFETVLHGPEVTLKDAN